MAHSRWGRERALGYKMRRFEHAKNEERSFGAKDAPQDDMVRDDGGVCALGMTLTINSGDDEER